MPLIATPITPPAPEEETPAPLTLDQAAQSPVSVTIDGTTTQEHSLRDRIAYENRSAANSAMSKIGFGISIAKLRPHGSA